MFELHVFEWIYKVWSVAYFIRKLLKPMGSGNLNPILKKIAKAAYNLGDHNDPLNAVLAIAIFKGINRPLFTMMDKESDPQVKKYAAFREGLTEVVAASTYILTNKLLVNPVSKYLQKKSGGSLGKITHGVEFLGVCVSAVFLIPLACNLLLNPIMKGVARITGKKKQTDNKLDIKENVVPELSKPQVSQQVSDLSSIKGPNSLLQVLQNKYTPYNGGNMKVGV